MVEKIKEMFYYLSFEWDFKSLSIQYPIMLALSTFLFYEFGAGVVALWWVMPVIFALMPFIVLTSYWLIKLRPVVRDIERELERREKYSWMYDRFTKHER